jgi:UDP-N-acetylmuramate dehydrogenase
MKTNENVTLAPYTTFGIGGPARYFVAASTEEEVVEAVEWAAQRSLPLFVLGGGSNLLVADCGFDGLVLKIELRGIEAAKAPGAPDQAIFRAAAGADWDAFVERTVQAGCSGIECLAGIPGSVGGTPVQNVGAYGQEVASAIDRVRVFDLEQRAFVEFSATECGFSYRKSRFNQEDRGRYIVTRVDYRLTAGGAPAIRYGDLQRELSAFAAAGREPSLAEVAATVRRVRRAKGMLMVEGDPDCASAGSFFKNPLLSVAHMQGIGEMCGKEPPHYMVGEGVVKVPAAWLIEQAGFSKGYRSGAAGISTRHTLALTNRGGATAQEILTLADEIKEKVKSRFSVQLEMEPVMLGF